MTPERLRRVEAIYHAARMKPAPARAGYVRDACADDEDLRREVESLLAKDASEALFLEPPRATALAAAAALVEAGESAVTVGGPNTAMSGQRFGSYEIVSRLGAGGMDELYRVRDTKLRRDVADRTRATVISTRRTAHAANRWPFQVFRQRRGQDAASSPT